MVAILRLLKLPEMLLELLAGLPGRPVDALEHRAVLVPSPVGASYVEQFERAWINLTGALQVRPTTEICESVVGVGGDHRRFFGGSPYSSTTPASRPSISSIL